MKIQYREIKFRSGSLRLIEQVNQIIEDYQELGYSLTLRQVYYQLVARDVIPNTERSYKNLGNLIADGRIAGLIDWTAIEDRTRNLRGNAHWDTPGDIISSAALQFAYNKWSDQAPGKVKTRFQSCARATSFRREAVIKKQKECFW
ncbi:hypothetical protein [Paenibacillus sp. y28]|uniref:hypothetical protein n=1 Tax=Paenibacillus sp. y28 TaxID=3129110 RepID=UPI00301A511B